MTDAELEAYYAQLLIIQYADKPNAQATVSLLASTAVANQIIGQVGDAFTIATAIGAQLDILGQFVGAKRRLPGYAPGSIFLGLPAYNDPNAGNPSIYGGFGDYTEVTPHSDLWADYNSSAGTYVLSDGEMRLLIQYLAVVDNALYSVSEIDSIFFRFFDGFVTITDNQDMTITFTHNPSDPGTLFGIVDFMDRLPHPGGVEVLVA